LVKGEAEKGREAMTAFWKGPEEVGKLFEQVMSRVWVS